MTASQVFTLLSLLLAGPAATVSPSLAGAPPPHVSVGSLDQLDVPEAPFDDSADADRDVARAFYEARIWNKRVLIDLGANWCADCRILSGLMDLPEVARFLDAHYVVVSVDVGRFNRNLQIPAHFGIALREEGVPCVIIADPDGRLVNVKHTAAFVDTRRLRPQDIVGWLAWWAR